MVEKNLESRLDDLETLLTQLETLTGFDERKDLFQRVKQEWENLTARFNTLTGEDAADAR